MSQSAERLLDIECLSQDVRVGLTDGHRLLALVKERKRERHQAQTLFDYGMVGENRW
jgi:hypothetical protein